MNIKKPLSLAPYALPAYILAALWLLAREQPQQTDLQLQRRWLEDLRNALPVPRTRWQRFWTSLILGWIDLELEGIYRLLLAGVGAVGIVKNDL